MSADKIIFLAPVANADASILRVPLKNGFGFIGLQMQQARTILALVEDTIPWSAGRRFFMDYPFLNMQEKVVYFVCNSLTVEPVKEGQDWWSAYSGELAQFENQKVLGYLVPTIRKLKLVSRGNIDVPFWYYFGKKDNRPEMYMGHSRGGPPTGRDIFHLDEGDLESVLLFLDQVQMPLNLPYLELAFENYELSYQAPSDALSFLTLMICLEILFNPGRGEIRYRLSRNVAVLFGETTEQSEDLFKRVRSYYDTRSEIVHSGKTDTLQQEEVPKIREICRLAIKKLVVSNIDKDTLMDDLNRRSFGSSL